MAGLDCEAHWIKLDSVANDICRRNPKSAIRNPKEIRIPKSEKCAVLVLFELRISFGFRISAFGLRECLRSETSSN